MLNGPDDPRHGTPGGYTRHKCRCDFCRVAATEYMAEQRKRNGLPPSHKAFSHAAARAATWVREEHPEVWARLYAEALERYGIGKPGPRR